ncbi:type VI secretion system protein TssA [Enterobacteriaceae bacterium 4M9]|nr:type VI secretion system protein TssA [Enterobacteriaceae bacterium 4M9]
MAERDDWLEKLTTPLPPEQIRARISDDNPHWEFIDGEMVKLGALSHGSLDIKEVQRRILVLLASESKDFRLVVHLLRTLQHAGQPQEVLLALLLLSTWVEAYWSEAWPHNATMKSRLAQQVLKRFSTAANLFIERADDDERQQALGALARLALLWQADNSALAAEVDALGVVFRRQPERVADVDEMPGIIPSLPSQNPLSVAGIPAPDLDATDDKAWRQTQLRMAQMLCERQPENPLGYRMRRNAVWQGITSAPLAQADGRTPLAAFSADRMAEYAGAIASPSVALWEQVEQSLTLAPYWFEGHRLSAKIALALGHTRVAGAIREELQFFLQRLPQIAELRFSDRSPFLPDEVRSWLEEASVPQGEVFATPLQTDIDQEAVWQCWREQGTEAALVMLDSVAAQLNPRGQFYCQLLGHRLLEQAGMTTLARQGYGHLYRVARDITLAHWEPELIAQLQEQQHSSEG